MSQDLTPPRQLAHRLIDSGRANAAERFDAARTAAAAVDRLYLHLARWVGVDGAHALFMRALAQARAEHPLDTMQLRAHSSPYIEGVAETVAQHGSDKVAEALEAILVMLIELLGRLIGEEMTRNLIERGLAEFAKDDLDGESLRAEA